MKHDLKLIVAFIGASMVFGAAIFQWAAIFNGDYSFWNLILCLTDTFVSILAFILIINAVRQ